MSAVRVRYAVVGERWSIEIVGQEGLFDLIPVSEGVSVARNDTGALVEMIVDSAIMPPEVVRLAVDAFGEQVRPYVTSPSAVDLEVVLGEIDQPPRDALVAVRDSGLVVPWRWSVTLAPLPGEPGVPVASSPQLYEAPVLIDPTLGRPGNGTFLERRVQIEQRAQEAELVVTVNGVLPGGPWWVRLSDNATGVTIALGRLEETIVNRVVGGNLRREPAMSTRMTFGLDVPIPELHVAVSDTPLVEVGDREQRRRQWADDLAGRAESVAARDPKYAARLWADAAEVYRAVDDEFSAQRCDERSAENRRRVRRRTWWIVLAGVALVATLVVAAVAIFSGDDDGDGAAPAVAETAAPLDSEPPATAPVTAVAPADELPVDSGPLEFRFDERLRAVVELVDSDELGPGSTLRLSILATVSFPGVYDRLGCLSVEQGLDPNQVGPITGPVPTYEVELRRPLINGNFDRVELEPFAVKREISRFQAPPGQCTFGEDDPTLVSDVEVEISFGLTDVEWMLPADIEPGVWEVVLINGVGTRESLDGRRLAFRVAD
jgi:hypothetical protein